MLQLLVSDIHGNWEALEAVAGRAAQLGAETCYCLGDVVGYGADPNACTAWVQAHAAVTIRGNHDRVCVAPELAGDFNPIARAAVEWTAAQLTPSARAFLSALPRGPLPVDHMTLAHGSPLDEDEYLVLAQQAGTPLAAAPTAITWIGHTHLQGGFAAAAGQAPAAIPRESCPAEEFSTPHGPGLRWRLALDPAAKYLLNPGSVGQPRDGDPRAGFALFDPAANAVHYYRLPYDHAAAAAKILAAGLPPQLANRLARGR